MKTVIKILLCTIFCTTHLICQNAIDPLSLPNTYSTDGGFDWSNDNVFNRNNSNFVVGWNYGDEGRQLDELMNINSILNHWETSVQIPWQNHGENIRWFLRIRPLCFPDDHSVGACQAVYYEPTIDVDRTDGFVPTAANASGAVFGFQNKFSHSGVYSTQGRLRIEPTVSTSLPILSNVWPKNILKYWKTFGDAIIRDPVTQLDIGYEGMFGRPAHGLLDQRNSYNGKELYLSINLKSTVEDLTSKANMLEDVLLSLKVKYYASKVNSDSTKIGYIKFYEEPGNLVQSITTSLNVNRGKARNEVALTSPTTNFVVSPKMLITQAPFIANEFITLSARFRCWYNKNLESPFLLNNSSNPYLIADDKSTFDESINPPDGNDYDWVIDSMDVIVEYDNFTGIGVEIDWIKIETPKARELFRGVEDRYIRYKVHQAYELFLDNEETKNAKISGFYINDECDMNLWSASRYLNMLMDTLTNSEVNRRNIYPSHHLHANGYKSFFNGVNLYTSTGRPRPYISIGCFTGVDWADRQKTFGWMRGYRGFQHWDNNQDQNVINVEYSDNEVFNSKYETAIPDNMGFGNINYNYYQDVGVLFAYEKIIHDTYYKRHSLLFNNKPWVAWMWFNSTWKYHSPFLGVYNYDFSPLTGEELRLQLFHSIALGAKGQYYWRKNRSHNNNFINQADNVVEFALQPSNNSTFLNRLEAIESGLPELEDLLVHEEMYGDFIDFTPDLTWDLYYQWRDFVDVEDPDQYSWALMGLQPFERVYIGGNSIRTGFYKHTQWVTQNSETLEQLKLAAWLGKGFSTMYQQRDGYATDIIEQFIDIDNITTRPLGRTENGQPLFEQGVVDSGFYDITILKHNSFDLDKVFYLSVVNRRTDPLIFFRTTPEEEDEHFLFLSTYELEQLCDDGGENPMRPQDGSHEDEIWQMYYWARQGSREISVPFNFKFSSNPNDVAILRVSELRTEDDEVVNTSWPWWQQERYNNYVDVVIKSNESLTLNYLPGEGKMFKVEIVGTIPLQGELANSNQTKLIAYPKNQTGNQDFSGKDDTVFYHMVYHRKDPITEKYNVYYRRSLNPYTHDLGSKGIQWGQEYQLAHSLVLYRDLHLPSLLTDSIVVSVGSECECKYPSIVARWDEVNERANIYALFSCSQPSYTDTPRVFIVEKVFDINSNPSPELLSPIGYGYCDDNDGTEIDRWGLSSINASLTGNFYAWNDYFLGITAGFKEPDDRGLITNKLNMKYNTLGQWSYGGPSLNTYSGIQIGDKHAAVVWHEEATSGPQRSRIYYSMLSLDQNDDIYHHVPISFSTGEVYFHDAVMLNGMAWLHPSDPLDAIYKNPILYRTIEGKLDDSSNIVFFGIGDRVYWEGKRYGSNPKSDIFMKMLDLGDSNNWNCLYPLRIYDINTSLCQPNLSQGSFFRGELSYPFNFSDSAIVVNFVSDTGTIPSYNANIYQIDHDFWRIFQKNGLWPGQMPDTNFVNIEPMLTELGKGINPHLARLPVVNREEDWAINQRVFESAGQIINTSYRFFIPKGFTEQKKIYPVLRIFDSESGEESQISQFHIVDYSSSQFAKIPQLYSQIHDENGMKFLDTAVTSWFRLPDFSQLSFFVSDYKSELFDVEIERMSDRETFSMPVFNIRDKARTFNKVNLINGGKEQYRIRYIRKNNHTWFMPEVMISNEIDFETNFDRMNDKDLERNAFIEEQTVDLGLPEYEYNILAYPNPSGDKVNLMIRYNSNDESRNFPVQIVVTNLIGEEIFRHDWFVNKQYLLDFSDMMTGVYYINALILDTDAGNSVVRKQISIIR